MTHLLGSRRPLPAGVALLLVALATCACRTAPEPLSHTVASPEALAAEVLERLAASDRDGLAALMLTRDEFQARVWPHLPVSRPETNMPMSFVWNRLKQQSDGRLAQVLAAHGGHRYELVTIAFRGETSTYDDLEVTRDSVVTVRLPDGTTEDLELFGSMIGGRSGYKVFSYVTD